MNTTVSGLCLAAAVGFAATLGAQSSTTTTASPAGASDREVTVSGCLSKAAGGYMLTNARVEPNASASTTTAPGATTTAGASGSAATTGGATGSAATTAGTTGSAAGTAGATGTSGEAAAAASPTMTWMLSGDNDLEKHVGHKIQVTGKSSWDSSKSAATSTATSTTTASGSASADHPHLDVKSIKMMSTSCS